MIIGITSTSLHCHSLPLSLFNSWCCSTFSCFFSFIKVSDQHASYIRYGTSLSLSTIMMSCVFFSNLWSVFTEKVYSIFTLIFLALSLICVHTTWFLPEIHNFFYHPMENQTISIILPQAVLPLCEHFSSNHMTDCSFLSSNNLHRVSTLRQFCSSFCLFSVLGLVQPLAFPQFLSSVFLSIANCKFPGYSLYLFFSLYAKVIKFLKSAQLTFSDFDEICDRCLHQ